MISQIDLRFNAGVEYNGIIFASAIYINGLFSLDLVTQKITYIKSFSREKPCYAIHKAAFLYGSEAWFIPQHGQYIAIVNLETLDIEYLDIPYHNIKADSRIKAVYYSGGIIKDKYLYLVPVKIDTLLLIDLETKKMYPYYDVSAEDGCYLYGTYADGCIYLAPYMGSTFMKVNLTTNERFQYPWKYPFKSFTDVVLYENKLWFCPFYSDLILNLDLNTKEIEEIPLKEFYDSECKYEQIQIYKDRLFFIPFQANKILEFHVKDQKMLQKELNQEWLENGRNGFTKIFSKDSMILASRYKSVVLIYDDVLDEFQEIHLRIDRDALIYEIEHNQNQTSSKFEDFVHEDLYASNGCYKENFWGIEKYIELAFSTNDLVKDCMQKCGETIWSEIKERSN